MAGTGIEAGSWTETDDMRRNLLLHDVRRFRDAIEACHRDLDPVVFSRFPRGCCGDVAQLLAAYLRDRGHGAFTYVCGSRPDGGDILTHAWLEGDGFIIDITGDQFAEGAAVRVTPDRDWHDDRFPERREHLENGDFRAGCGVGSEGLHAAYPRILAEIETMGSISKER